MTEGSWVVVLWKGYLPVEVGRYPVWRAADNEAQQMRLSDPVRRVTVEAGEVWDRQRPTYTVRR
ncbi:hypothetical protein DVT68_13320 [Dyella solisilvae]|uniref:Uncharacterized protein n=2 Tax=Dyella solisilvae TaxID=1920168 RepID=A0A370K5Z8_9GAMM|nr:hypothetical protein DVT68_13320 [Dyella solisilvae]